MTLHADVTLVRERRKKVRHRAAKFVSEKGILEGVIRQSSFVYTIASDVNYQFLNIIGSHRACKAGVGAFFVWEYKIRTVSLLDVLSENFGCNLCSTREWVSFEAVTRPITRAEEEGKKVLAPNPLEPVMQYHGPYT